jgi:hypothetical protein
MKRKWQLVRLLIAVMELLTIGTPVPVIIQASVVAV